METIIKQTLPEAHSENFTPYALHVVIERALPSIEDGLKTVARRIVYDMGTDDGKFHKGAHFIGSVLSRYHPHGNVSLYESVVLLSQEFFNLNALVKARGNNGSRLDPYSYAAERYLELKISDISKEVFFKCFNNKTAWMVPTYDKAKVEPKLLPAIFPMILSQSNTGIAAGYAVSLPSHNLKDIAEATIFKINNPDADTKALMKYLKGPDYPTGGYVLNSSDLPSIYEKGYGSIILRGNIEETTLNGKDVLIINEIPNTTNLGVILNKLADLCKPDKSGNEGLLQSLIYDIKDKSDETKIEVHIIPKKNADLNILKNLIFQNTDMQSTQGYNSNVLLNYTLIKNASLEFILRNWITFRIKTIRKEFSYELKLLNEKLAINNALIKAHKNIDDIIKLIRSTKGNKEEIKSALISKYEFADKEADYIINQELYKISSLQINTLNEENKKLNNRYGEIIKILPNEKAIKSIIIDELNYIANKYGRERQTKLIDLESKIDNRDLVEEKELFVVVTTDKFIYSKEINELRVGSKKNKGQNFAEIKKGKIIDKSFIINNKTKLFCLSKKGLVFIIDAYKLNVNNIHINNLIDNLNSEDSIISFLPIYNTDEGYLLTVNNKSFFKKTKISEYFLSNRNSGIIAVKLDNDEELIDSAYVENNDQLVLLSTNKGYVSKFNLNNIIEAGRVAKGRPLIRFKEDGESIVNLNVLAIEEENNSSLLLLTKKGIGKLTPIKDLLEKKTEKGMSSAFKAIGLNKEDELLKNKIVTKDDILIVNTNLGKTIKIETNNINVYSRNAKGDKLISLNDSDFVNSINIMENDI